MNSRIAVVNGNMMKATTSTPFVSTTPNIDYRLINTQTLANSQIYIEHEKNIMKLMSSKSKDITKEKDLITNSQSGESFNAFIYEIDYAGKLVIVDSFTQDFANPEIV